MSPRVMLCPLLLGSVACFLTGCPSSSPNAGPAPKLDTPQRTGGARLEMKQTRQDVGEVDFSVTRNIGASQFNQWMI